MAVVRQATPADTEVVTRLVEDKDRFYGATEFGPLEVRARETGDALFGELPAARVLLALDDGRPVGFAAYSFLWPSIGVVRSMYLKDLYVVDSHRRAGVGKILMDALYDAAREHGCPRVEWTSDAANPGAQRFYEQLGVPVVTTKLFYRAAVD